MQRTNKVKSDSKVTAILTADWHLRETAPVCRTDDFWNAQWQKVNEVRKLQEKHQCPVLHAGDLFAHWRPSPHLLSKAIASLPKKFYTIYGNHDLPQHSLALAHKSGLYTLASAGSVIQLHYGHWGQRPLSELTWQGRHVLVWHVMTWKGEKPWPGIVDLPAIQILERYPQCDLILTGHNHRTFVEEKDGRLLVNPGALTRHTADLHDHRPCVFCWNVLDNTVEQVFLSIKQDVVSREHIERKENRDARIMAFVERLNADWQRSVSFEENLEQFCHVNQIKESVLQIIGMAVDRAENQI